MWKTIVLCIVTMGLATTQKISYKNYKLFSVVPTNFQQLELLKELRRNVDDLDGYRFWKDPSFVNREVILMVSPYKSIEFSDMMTDNNLRYRLIFNNIQKLIDDTMPKNRSRRFDFNSYHTRWEIYDNLDELAEKYPDKVEVVVGGTTFNLQEIKGVKINNGKDKPGIFLEGGMHGREWISPAIVMYILHQLLMSNDSNVRYVADNHNWYIFPIFNPDGYEFSFTRDRLWKKTLKPSSSRPFCRGTDPNKNWNYRWNTTGTSNNPCDDNYPGSEPFSEIETETMSDYIRQNLDNFYAYVSFHSFSQNLLFPYGYTKDHIFYYNELNRIAKIAVEKLEQRYGTKYQTGCIGEFGMQSGLSVDYVAGVFRKIVVYLFELRDKCKYGFLLPPDQIIPTGKETLDAIVAVFAATLRQEHAKNN